MLASITSILPSGIGFNKSDDRDRERQDKEREQRERDRERERESERQQQGHAAGAAGAEEVTPRANNNDGKLRESTVDEHGVKKRRERNPNETFIVVRPPPSVSNHPLNLQLQLVPPQAKERSTSGASSASGLSSYSSRPSGDYGPSDEAGDVQSLRRVESIRSNRSDPTTFYASSSSASMTSIASSASTTSGGRRMIVPLYNLSAHNVMTNTVLDAGTDAKVAKFHKRGMEILALAVLECVEVWPSHGHSGAGPGHVAFLSATDGASAGAGGSAGGVPSEHEGLLGTPASSAISLSSTGSHPPHPHPYPLPLQGSPSQRTPKALPPLPGGSSSAYGNVTPTPTPTPSGAKRIFGKIFKKRDSQIQSSGGAADSGSLSRGGSMSIEVRSPSNTDLRSATAPRTGTGLSFGGISRRRSMNVSSPTPSHFSVPPGPAAGGSIKDQPQLQPPILGIQPTLSAPVVPPVGRPTRYVWIVRKWLKGTDEGLLGGVVRNVSSTIGSGISGLGAGGSNFASSSNQGQLQPGGQVGAGELGVEVRFEWVRGQSKRLEKRKARRSTGQVGLAKRGSTSYSQEDATMLRSRSSQSRGRRPATSSGAGGGAAGLGGTPRVSGSSERRRSTEHPDSWTNSLTSAMSEELRNRSAVEEDEGEESDPEDSETPWTCSLVVSSVPSNATRLWEHEYIEHGQGLTKRSSRKSGMSHTGEAPSEASHPSHLTPNPNQSPSPPPPPPKSRTEVPGTLLRLKVGALSPAPHHPKVVAQLKVPYPLPDVEVSRARIQRRVLTPAGVARPVSRGEMLGSSIERSDSRDTEAKPKSRGVFGTAGGAIFRNGNGNGFGFGGGNSAGGEEDEGLVLTAEEIKDVLSCTAFWVVVREGFGGVGKVTRKGDGWRIRG